MNAKDHNSILGWLFLGLGALELLSNLFALVYIPLTFARTLADMRKVYGKVPWWFESLSSYIVILVIVLTVVFTIPKLIAAYGILKEKTWGRMAGIVAGALSLIGIPVGTGLGIYAIWFLTSEKGKEFYLGAANRSALGAPPELT